MRMFIAIDLPKTVRSEIGALVLSVRDHGADVKWVEARQLHLTLKFLADVDDSRQDALRDALLPAAFSFAPFQLHLSGIGVFPDIGRPRVFWIGSDEGEEHVRRLAASIDSALEPAGFARESRPFQVHLTIGRVRSPKNLAPLLGEIKSMPFSSAHRFDVDHLNLYRSTLTSERPVHEVIEKFSFGRS